MPFNSAQEAFDEFQRTGQYANSAKHFAGDPAQAEALFGEYKQMVPQNVKHDFKAKVAGNENRALEGLQQGISRNQQGIYDIPEQGRALYRRIGAGLGTGLDMNKAYDFGGGTAREVGTTDMAKWGTTRGITDVERQRNADFQAAGSPESYWRQFRGNQIQGLLDQGAIQRDPNGGYYNPGPGGGQHYGQFLQGYNLGQSPMGAGRGDPRNVGYTPQTVSGGLDGGLASYGQGGGGGGSAPLPTYSAGQTASPTGSAGFAPRLPSSGGIAGGWGGGQITGAPGAPAGPPQGIGAANGGVSASSGGGVAPPLMAPGGGGGGPIHNTGKQQGDDGLIYERPPGQVGPFGAPGTGNPSGNSLFPAVPTPGAPGNPFPDPNNPTGGGFVPGWRPEGNLPGVPVTGNGLAPGMGGFQDFENTPYGGLLGQQGAGDVGIQGFNLNRAQEQYGRGQGLENTVLGQWGAALGIDPMTGQPLQGQAADVANARSFGQLAPQVSRIMGDTDALQQRLRRDVPEGGEKNAASSDLLRSAQGQIGGLRQSQAQDALSGILGLSQQKQSFDPGAYTGGAQSLLGAYGQGRGQDLGAYANALQTMLGERGQDVTWGLGQGNLGLGWAGLGQQGQQNAWQNYLTGRGQDIGLYSGTRGQDLDAQAQQAAIAAQRSGQRSSFWGQLAGGVGSLLGGIFASDATVKKDVRPHEASLDAVKMLQPYNYTYNAKVPSLEGVEATSFMAQDVEKILPDAVGEVELAAGTIKTLQPMRILATVVNAVKELDAKVERGLAAYGKKGGRR